MSSQVLAILRKDVVLERRGKANLNALIFLAGLILVIISFALGPSQARLHSAAGGILWVAFAFAGVLAFARTYQSESDNRAFEGLLLSGASAKAIYAAKLLGTLIVMLLVEAITAIAMAILYNLPLWHAVPGLALIAVLGTIGFASVGVLYGRLTMSVRAREVMLPILVLPVVLPAILAAVRGTSQILAGSFSGSLIWIELLIVFDVVFVTAGLLTYEALCEE